MVHRVWRQFKPKLALRGRGPAKNLVVETRQHVASVMSEVYGHQAGHVDVDVLATAAAEQARRVTVSPNAAEWFTLLILRAPAAASAQQQMDKHPHGYHNKQARLYQLIDFNDAFVSTVLELSDDERRGFIDVAKGEIARFCGQVGSHMFSDEQFEAITRGLSREVAVYLGALSQGFSATMTSRAQDAMGVDMIITDPLSGKSLNIDCKTPSAYHYRIQDLVQQGRLSEQAALLADQLGYTHEQNGHGAEVVAVTLLRVDQNEVGDVKDFIFTQPQLLGDRLRSIFGTS